MNCIKTMQTLFILVCSLMVMNGHGAAVSVPRDSFPLPAAAALSPEQAYLDHVARQCEEAQTLVLQKIQPGDIAVFDVDDTAIATYAMAHWELKQALPLPPVLHLFHFLVQHKVEPCFITARAGETPPEGERMADPIMQLTMQQLENAGYNTEFDLFIRPSEKDNPGKYKFSTRYDLSKTRRIVLNIGDRSYDFETGHGTPEENKRATAVINVLLPHPDGLNKDMLRHLIEMKRKSAGAATPATPLPAAAVPAPSIPPAATATPATPASAPAHTP